jgi:hypothetical protein
MAAPKSRAAQLGLRSAALRRCLERRFLAVVSAAMRVAQTTESASGAAVGARAMASGSRRVRHCTQRATGQVRAEAPRRCSLWTQVPAAAKRAEAQPWRGHPRAGSATREAQHRSRLPAPVSLCRPVPVSPCPRVPVFPSPRVSRSQCLQIPVSPCSHRGRAERDCPRAQRGARAAWLSPQSAPLLPAKELGRAAAGAAAWRPQA